MTPRAFAILFVFGAVVLTLLDSVHVHTHTLAYAHPAVYGSALWVPLLMGSAAAFGGWAYVLGWARLGGPAKLPLRPKVALAVASFALMYAASGLLPATATTKLIVLTVAAVVIHREVDGSRVGAILMIVGALIGPIVEAINPGFHYLEPDFIGVPVWLPALYACATPALGQLSRLCVARGDHREVAAAYP
jgi:hypothetical protein